jgi:hypothetical protein
MKCEQGIAAFKMWKVGVFSTLYSQLIDGWLTNQGEYRLRGLL